ncbi:hypothetical protein R1sor_005712 [Riccia sorocarpa]|uniref:C2H2-type domain-containing protein n=1 Tax=Riccia sorocarpa TaxID=122646 RepID=A0ABD3HMN7_9MARC
MQPVEDIWTCHRCGWTYPNHHPSAKHRRNHKKVCGKVPGFIIDDHKGHGHGDGGSSDEASSGDEGPNHKHEAKSAAPSVTPSAAIETLSRSFDISDLVQKSEPEAPAAPPVTEPAAAPAEVSNESTKTEVSNGESVSEAAKPQAPAKPVLGSAAPHPEHGTWNCHACGWTYPNAHPSAKHRRNHKKHCPGKAGVAVHANGGSSDDDSDSEHHAAKAAQVTEKATDAPTTAPELHSEKAEPESTPIQTTSREFNLDSLARQEPAPVAEVEISKPEVESTPLVPLTAAAVVAPVAVPEAPSAPAPSAAPVVAKGSAVPHPHDDLWICKACGWTYPNHHPSAKHRRHHKKVCSGKKAAAAPAHIPGGSSDDDSDSEHTHRPVHHPPPLSQEAPPTEIKSREFSFESVAQPAATPEVEGKPEETVTLVNDAQPPEVPAEKPEEVGAATEETGEAKKEISVAKPQALPPGELKQVSHEASAARAAPKGAKPGTNHKNCPGKDGPATVSRDTDLGSKALVANGVKVKPSENGKVPPQVLEVTTVQAPAQAETLTTSVVSKEIAKKDIPTGEPTAVESKKALESASAAATSVAMKSDLHHSSPSVESSDQSTEKSKLLRKSHEAPQVGNEVQQPIDDLWICKECGWTYPNHHPSAKHRRHHKKICPGKVALAASATGGSSDDSGDEHDNRAPVRASELEALCVTEDASVTDKNEVRLLASESQQEKTQSDLREIPIVDPIVEAPDESNTPSGDFTGEEKLPKVEEPVECQQSLLRNSTVVNNPAILSKDVSSEELKVAKPAAASGPALGSAVTHPEHDTWRCGHCDWTYPNAHPSAKHRRNHKKHCPGLVAAHKGGSSDDDSDHESHSRSVKAPAPAPEAVASVSRDFQLPTQELKESHPRSVKAPAAAPTEESAPAPEAVASVSRDFQLPTQELKEQNADAAPSLPKEEEAKPEAAPVPKVEEQKEEASSAVTSTAPAPKVGSAVPHPEDPNDIWICKACGWTYPNAHPSAKHRRNHKKHCSGKHGSAGHAPGGSSDEDSDNESSHSSHSSRRGPTSAAATAPAEVPVVKERAMPDLAIQQPAKPAEAEAPKIQNAVTAPVESEAPKNTVRTTVAQLVYDERSREQEAKVKEEAKSGAPHDPNAIWVCKECGWTYPNRHPSAKHRKNHKKVCKKTRSSKGGSSSDTSSSDDELGKKKCFPCLSL